MTFLRLSISIYFRFPILICVNDPKMYVTFIVSVLLIRNLRQYYTTLVSTA